MTVSRRNQSCWRSVIIALGSLALLVPATDARTIKIGLLLPLTGPAGESGERLKQGAESALEELGRKIAGDNLELVIRDTGDASLQRIRQLAQELVVRDRVEYLCGLDTTPAVAAVADVVNQAKVPLVIFNSGTADITKKSAYFVRVSFTQWVVSYPLGKWLAQQGKKRMLIVTADFAPGYDASAAFAKGFTEGGGTIVDTIKVPLGSTDPASYLQKIQDVAPDAVFMFFNVGPFQVTFIRDYLSKGLRKQGIDLYGTGELDETNLKLVGPEAEGIVTSFIYGLDLETPKNSAFVAGLRKQYGGNLDPSAFHVQAYDGMQVIFQMIRGTNGVADSEKAMLSVKGFAWDSPRGRVHIDADNREIIQDVYLRRVIKKGGRLLNREFLDFGNVRLQP